MKKLLFSTLTALAVAFQLNAQVACTIDTTLIPAAKFSYPDTLPCVVRGVAYTQTVQFKIPASVDPADFGLPAAIAGLLGQFYIDSIVVTGVTGLPTGITPTYNPSTGIFLGGQGGCFKLPAQQTTLQVLIRQQLRVQLVLTQIHSLLSLTEILHLTYLH